MNVRARIARFLGGPEPALILGVISAALSLAVTLGAGLTSGPRPLPGGGMSAAMITAIAALLGSAGAALAAAYGSRSQSQAQNQGSALTGYDNLTQRLVAERDKAERDQGAAEARAAAAEAHTAALEAEVARLRLLVTQLGGTP
jgi:anaerobic selenocysteine-containing dehydrogenase